MARYRKKRKVKRRATGRFKRAKRARLGQTTKGGGIRL